MADWIATLLMTPYIAGPIFVILWKWAKLPEIDWSRIATGFLFTFAGALLKMMAQVFAAYQNTALGVALMSMFDFLAAIAVILGLAIAGLYALVHAFELWKV